MTIAGHGPEHDSLQKLVLSLGLTERIRFLGWVIPEHIPKLLEAAMVVMIPSRLECLSRVAVEAALSAKPVITTNVGGMAEVVVHDKTGMVVEAENPQALAKACLDLLTHPPKASSLGEAARERALEVFDKTRCVDTYHNLYEQLGSVHAG